ncbi:MAG: hypothetical protein U5K76_00645 [Woeseiaceae bacterium]|nr:hypothetical protein [Woeseiaceae bacterium]
MSEQTWGGPCLCGQVRYRVSEALRDALPWNADGDALPGFETGAAAD